MKILTRDTQDAEKSLPRVSTGHRTGCRKSDGDALGVGGASCGFQRRAMRACCCAVALAGARHIAPRTLLQCPPPSRHHANADMQHVSGLLWHVSCDRLTVTSNIQHPTGLLWHTTYSSSFATGLNSHSNFMVRSPCPRWHTLAPYMSTHARIHRNMVH